MHAHIEVYGPTTPYSVILYFGSIADEISILYELDMVTKLQRSPHKSELHAALSLAHDVCRGGRAALNSIHLFLFYL